MADEEFQIVNTPKGPVRFPKSMSHDDIQAVLDQEFMPAESNVEGKESRDLPGLEAPQNMGTIDDVLHSGVQWGRDVLEHIVAVPKTVDDLERSAVQWLKSNGDPTLAKVGEMLGGATEKDTELLPGVPAPSLDDAQWLGQQAFGDPYEPKTLPGKVTGPALTGLAGVALGAGPAMSFGRLAAPFAKRVLTGGLTGAALGAGHEAYRKLRGQYDR